jgi:hypothetical protein
MRFTKSYLLAAASALLFSAGTANAAIETITFDDIPNAASEPPIANGYAGLNWNNFYVLNASTYGGGQPNGYTNGIVTAPNVAYNAYGNPASIAALPNSSFTLYGGFFNAAWNNGLSITAQGYDPLGNVIAADSKTFSVDTTGPIDVSFNWSGLGEVLFTSSGGVPAGYFGSGEHFALDNVTVNVSAVPLPAALPLFGAAMAGLGGLGFARRRKAA